MLERVAGEPVSWRQKGGRLIVSEADHAAQVEERHKFDADEERRAFGPRPGQNGRRW